jgi:hypothetical protein
MFRLRLVSIDSHVLPFVLDGGAPPYPQHCVHHNRVEQVAQSRRRFRLD